MNKRNVSGRRNNRCTNPEARGIFGERQVIFPRLKDAGEVTVRDETGEVVIREGADLEKSWVTFKDLDFILKSEENWEL